MRAPSPFLLFLISACCSSTLAASETLSTSTSEQAAAVVEESPILASGKASPVGTKDAPFDGKDGMPHAGPWIETAAERDRKKLKEAGEDPLVEPVADDTKEQFGPKHIIPESNNGVMDDPNRSGPKEGTRGTEGGVSEKLKTGRFGQDKFPATPKERPPLPHSEAEHVEEVVDTTTDSTVTVDSPQQLEVSSCPGERSTIHY